MTVITVTEYELLARDANDEVMQTIGAVRERKGATQLTGAGTVALQAGTRFVRVATNAPLLIDFSGATTSSTTGEYIPTGKAEIFEVYPGSTLTVAISA